ncbi:MAG TPA: hypothetical protein DD435_02090 [Cyanobacteria bacterium UBA8530]|nr:hypothetical protein [Cyanobacteria bacterium UBA8530]
MKNKNEANFRGNPPNLDQLANLLKDQLPRWNEVRQTAVEIGATWKWVYSESREEWSLRSYLAGDRFFAALTLTDGGFEVSFNLKKDEWEAVKASNPKEEAILSDLRERALESEEDPAWIHMPISNGSALALLTKILVVRAGRVQKPRLKEKKKK